jgi:RND superfamily putative drug exporter
VRVGVIRTVGSTGGVITSAGLIFAASMFGLMTASIYTMAEAGFILGMGILIDTFLVRTITVPAMAALIGQKNWWPSHLGKNAAQVYAAQQKKQQQLDQLTEQLVRMKVIPSRDNSISERPAPATREAGQRKERPWLSDDLLVRLKLIPGHKPRTSSRQLPKARGANGRAGDQRKATPQSPAATNGKASIDRLSDHALPLFDLGGLPDHVTDDLRESAMTGNGDGKHQTDNLLGHSLPLFGQDVLSHRPITIGANGNGHADGKANGDESIDHDLSQPLPLFGANTPANSNGNGHANGNGNG